MSSVLIEGPLPTRTTHMSFVSLQKRDRALRISLTSDGRQELQSRLDDGESIEGDTTLYDLLEDHTCNGWEWVRPEESGALTSAPILSDECGRDDDGLLTDIGSVYWFQAYQVLSPAAELLMHGHIEFQRAE